MIWVAVLGLTAFFLVLFGCGLTLSRVRKYREAIDANRARAFAEMAEMAEKTRRGDGGTRRHGE
ncbi:MAG: hypothetical protein P1S46_00320 [bacterium]|nr:hypothetical protein [bacterium]MDT8395808.1 hypothetical protein [bacterium]